MKITAFILFFFCIQVSATTLAQKVTLSEQKASLEKVINEIKQQTGYSFFYNQDWLQQAHPVDVQIKNAPLEVALKNCFANQPFDYAIVNKTIVLKPKDENLQVSINSQTVPIRITGKVTDSLGTPLTGATVTNKRANKSIITDDKGDFTISAEIGDELIISYIGYKSVSIKVSVETSYLSLQLHPAISGLKEVVVNTGYQTLSQERATGSFVRVDNDLYNRRTSPDILSKLDGVVSGVYFNGKGAGAIGNSLNNSGGLPSFNNQDATKLGITIRGQADVYTNKIGEDPLIVVDNFPYNGDINNLNPEMVESVTILKDAAAASIWGAKAGNGVIVITTKKGKLNQKMKVDFNSSITVGNKPDIFKSRNFLNSSDYIDVEKFLFSKSYFNSSIVGNTALSPIVQLLYQESNGNISTSDANNQVNAYRNYDVRNDYEKYIFQKSLSQQYGTTISGGTNNLIYSLSIGYDNNNTNMVRNSYDKLVINSNNTYTPLKNLEVTTAFMYSQINVKNDNTFGFPSGDLSTGGVYGNMVLPYDRFADANGTHLAVTHNLLDSYITDSQNVGFLNWQFKPLDELELADNTTKQKDLLFRIATKYKIASFLNAEIQYQNETQNSNHQVLNNSDSFYARNLINTYTQYDPSNKEFTYPIPMGGILNQFPSQLNSYNLRGQLNYNQIISNKHIINAIAGAEINENKSTSYSTLAYGYSNEFGTAVSNIDYMDSFPTNPGGRSVPIPAPSQNIAISTTRYLSYYSNIGYTYNNKYTLTISGRKDGANLFGIKTNDKITPLWSAGLGWEASEESFYHIDWLPYLKLRTTYGFNGNVYHASAYLIATYNTSRMTGLPTASVVSPPNPDLRWEKIRNINIALDFSLKRNLLNGTVEFYQKKGMDLLEPSPLAPSTGFSGFRGLIANDASTVTKGMELTLNSKNIDGEFKWNTTVLFSASKNRVLKYDVAQTSASIQSLSTALVGKPIFGVYSYKWGGLDPTNGDPQGYLNGKLSKDYTKIINNYSPDSLVFNGSAIPTIFGAFRNTFAYKQFSLSLNIVYKFGYVFRSSSTPLNYTAVLSNPISDFGSRWQKPGDEKITSVPSVIFPNNVQRNTFYQYSEILIQKGDHVRLQDISLSYDFGKSLHRKLPFEHFQIYSYINNIGILWRANKLGIDPDNVGIPVPMSITFGMKANF